jgi:hypothetical protein
MFSKNNKLIFIGIPTRIGQCNINKKLANKTLGIIIREKLHMVLRGIQGAKSLAIRSETVQKYFGKH